MLFRSEDDDGNAASKPNGSAFITEQQAADLVALCDEIGVKHVKLKKHLKVNSFTELKASEYASVVAKVEAKRK